MGRLIDADEFKNEVKREMLKGIIRENTGNALLEVIDAQPTAYDVEKVVKKMERKKQTSIECLGERNGTGFNKVMDLAIDIVRKGGEISESKRIFKPN